MEKYCQRVVEWIVGILVAVTTIVYTIELFLAKTDWTQVGIYTLIPSLTNGEAILIAVGMLGATVMPHVIYLHSQLVQVRNKKDDTEEEKRKHLHMEQINITNAIYIAFLVNSAMIIVTAAVFFRNGIVVETIEQAQKSLEPLLGALSSGAFGIALLASGLSSSAVGTMAEQIIMQGFIGLSIPMNVRRLITIAPHKLS